MVTSDIHDIVLHCRGTKVWIPNINSQNYLFINLPNDVAEKALHEMPGNVNLLLHMRCAITGTEAYIDVNDDETVHDLCNVY